MTTITPELIRAALSHIQANLPRDEWARVGMAIKSECPDDVGLGLFKDWSATADNYDAGDAASTWRSIKAGGGVTISTLLHLAKQNGFVLPKPDKPPPAPSAAELAQRNAERQQAAKAEAERRQADHAAAADQARALWDAASPAPADHGYLTRKGVQPHGLRVAGDGWLLVPLRDADGTLWNVQRIAPQRPANGATDKLFLPGGRKSGLWHMLGEPAGAAVVLMAEGYATAASVHEAGRWPVAVAFDAGNLLHVARELRRVYPAAMLVVCGDDDRATAKRTNTNTGRVKAQAAARAVRGVAVFPTGLQGQASDFNDMHQVHGLQAVRATVQDAIDAITLDTRLLTGGFYAIPDFPPSPENAAAFGLPTDAAANLTGTATQPPAHTGKTRQRPSKPPPAPGAAELAKHDAEQAAATQPPAPASKTRQRPGNSPAGAGGGSGSGGGNGGGAGEEAAAFDPFTVTDDGVYYQGHDKEGNLTRPLWVCSRLDVTAHTRDQDGQGWGYLLHFTDLLGHAKQWAMPARMLSGDGGEYRAVLLNMGLRIATSPTARNRLTEYIQTRSPSEFASCTDRIGWHPTEGGAAYVLQHQTIGDTAERIVFQTESAMENTFRVRKDVPAWRDRIGALCAGNSRLVFAVACAFAGPLLRLAGMESGGFHLRGDSSSGKTTALRLAASVNGGPSYMQRWRTTDNALEATAAQHCDALLILDELSQVDGKVAGECAYMLANEQSKGRSNRASALRPRLTWRLLFLSSGELSLADHMAEGMRRTRTGQEVRMADIPADAGACMGIFQNIHGHASAAAFASHLTREAQAVYGAPGLAFIEWACTRWAALPRRVRGGVQNLAAQWVPAGASGQVERVAARFALVGLAGELATEAELTGWSAGESERAARACFEAWLAARGGAGNGEVTAMLRQVRRFLEANGEGRFTWWHRAADDRAPKTLNRAGYRRMLNAQGEPIKTDSQHLAEYGDKMPPDLAEDVRTEYFILPEVFRAEVCQGLDYQAVCRVLLEHKALVPSSGRTYDCRMRLPGLGMVNCYCIAPTLSELNI